MTLTFPIFNLPVLNWTLRTAKPKPAPEAISEPDHGLAESEFLRELVTGNPEAIQSEFGLMAMMAQYPRHF